MNNPKFKPGDIVYYLNYNHLIRTYTIEAAQVKDIITQITPSIVQHCYTLTNGKFLNEKMINLYSTFDNAYFEYLNLVKKI